MEDDNRTNFIIRMKHSPLERFGQMEYLKTFVQKNQKNRWILRKPRVVVGKNSAKTYTKP